MLNKTNSIESVDPKNISEADLRKIAEVEKEMWAYGIGEYVKCDSCDKIHSKSDIFGHLSRDIQIQSVTQIEKIMGTDIPCNKCESNTSFIYDVDEYMQEIWKRYNESEAFLTIFRDENGEIRGFEDGYIDTFSIIYQREFKKYYGDMYEPIYNIIQKNIGIPIPNRILLCCSVGMEQKYASFFTLYNIIQKFFGSIGDKLHNEQILGLCEAVVGELPHAIYDIAGTQRLGIPENKDIYSKINEVSTNFQSDIFVNTDVINNFCNNMSKTAKKYMKLNKNRIKEIVSG